MIKKFFSENYKKPSFWVVAVSIVLCAVMAVCFLTDPIKKGEDKPEKEAASSSAVTSSEDTSTKAEITVSEVTTSKEESSLPAEAKEPATNSKPVTSSEPIKIDPAQELAAKRKELFDKLSPTQSVEVRNQVVDWLLSESKESEKKLYTDEEIAKMRAECDSYDIEPDLIMVTLTEKASKELFFKEFTPKDFPGIDCKAVESSAIESERIAVLTGKTFYGDDDYILDEYYISPRTINIYVNEQTNKNIIENMIKLQKMDIVEYVSFNARRYLD